MGDVAEDLGLYLSWFGLGESQTDEIHNNKVEEMLKHFTQSAHFGGLYRGGEWSEHAKTSPLTIFHR